MMPVPSIRRTRQRRSPRWLLRWHDSAPHPAGQLRGLRNTNAWRRRGVTVIEVLFAMAIALVGLTGIASLLLLGGKQASDSNQAAEAQAFAQDWYGEFSARGLNDSAKWAWWDDTNKPIGLKWFDKQLAVGFPSKGSSTLFQREPGRESICLDPTFFAGRDLNNTLTPSNWYRPAVFPYYQDRYNPLVDPANSSVISGLQWPDQPRMLRVTWGAVTSGSSFPTAFSSRILEQIFASQDDLTVLRNAEDGSMPPSRGAFFYSSASTTPLPVGRFAAESQYSWFATLTPNEPRFSETTTTELYTLSLVVVKKRDRAIYDPASSTPRASGTAATPSNAPQGERLALVIPQSGDFIGGSGGRVRLVSSDGVEPTVHVGDWIMLSKYYNFVPIGGSFRTNSFFRWYRVVAVDTDEFVGPLAAVTGSSSDVYGNTFTPMTPNDVWGQDVVLEGPDWSFAASVTTSSGVTVPTPTTATLVKGATSVYERIVNVP